MIGWPALAKHQDTSILSITVEKEYHQKKKVFSGTFNVEEKEAPVLMSPEGVVAFRGYNTSRITEKAFEDT